MSTSNNTAKGAAQGVLAILLCAGVVYGALAIAYKNPNPTKWWGSNNTSSVSSDSGYKNPSGADVSVDKIESNVIVSNIANTGLILKKAAVTTNSREFTYSFEPAAASGDLVVELSAAAKADYACADYISASVNSKTKTITVVCLKPFEYQITMKISLKDTPETFAVVLLDYQDRVLGMTPKLNILEDYPFAVDETWDETGGSLPADKTISKYNVEFTDAFKQKVIDVCDPFFKTSTLTTNSDGSTSWVAVDTNNQALGCVSFNNANTNIASASSIVLNGVDIVATYAKGAFNLCRGSELAKARWTPDAKTALDANASGALNRFLTIPYKATDFLDRSFVSARVTSSASLSPVLCSDYAAYSAMYGNSAAASLVDTYRYAVKLADLPYTEIISKLFDGTYNNIKLDLTFNDTVYSGEFALKLEKVAANQFSTSVSRIVF